jgi:putative addiction module CopG family antidote
LPPEKQNVFIDRDRN